jgi:DNA-binding response OmpR family regulator
MFVTGDALAPRTLQFLENSGLPYLSKPFLVEELKLAVSRRLERSREAAQSTGAAAAHKSRATSRRS